MENLTFLQITALDREITSARNLLSYGIRALETGAPIETVRDPILTMLSIGVEKYYKLLLGAIALESRGAWPSKDEMKGYGHGVLDMHSRILERLHQYSELSSEFIREHIEGITSDPVLEPLLECLDSYGRGGRFHYLDQLADSPQRDNPERYWEAAEHAALSDSKLKHRYELASNRITDQDAWNQFYSDLNVRLARSLRCHWTALSYCGIHGLFGPCGRRIGFEGAMDAVGRQ